MLKGMLKNGRVSICLKGITDIDEFIEDYAFVKRHVRIQNESYYSSIKKFEFEPSKCDYYFGYNTERGYDRRTEIAGYYYNDVYYVELILGGFYEEETYDIFLNGE